MQIITKPILITELTKIANERFIELTKAVVDLNKQVMVVDADLHSDQEALLLKQNSKQDDLWGINLYPQLYSTPNFIEFDSMINLRPSWGNHSRGVDNLETKKQITKLINSLITN